MTKQNQLDECVRASLEQYLKDLQGAAPVDMFSMAMRHVEKPVLEVAMQYAQGNQSRAAEILGITRSTLRKKLQSHHLL